MRYLFAHYCYTSQIQRSLLKLKPFYYQQINHIFSKTGKWDEEYSSAAVFREVESHWRDVFAKQHQSSGHRPSLTPVSTKGKKYVLAMFPYPSGQLHMGHVRVYTISDALARFYRSQGYQVIHPIGWDAFGLPAENAAIERSMSPAVWTDQNIRTMKEQFQQLGCSFDWWRELRTCDPEYYRWTQEIFLRLYKADLVYKKQAAVNWDPVDQTVLANEQVDQNGRAWRSGARVEKKLLNQWYIRTTRYSKALYDGLDASQLQGWQDIIKLQKNWIGECTGYLVNMTLNEIERESSGLPNSAAKTRPVSSVSVFTHHPELLHGVSFLGVRSDHGLCITGFRDNSSVDLLMERSRTDIPVNTDPCDTEQLGKARANIRCSYKVLNTTLTHPLTERPIPLIISDDLPFSNDGGEEFYVGYGCGSALDRRICQTSGFDVIDVLDGCSVEDYIAASEVLIRHSGDSNINGTPSKSAQPSNIEQNTAKDSLDAMESLLNVSEVLGRARLVNCSTLSGLTPAEARKHVLDALQLAHKGGYKASSGVHDWLISRQRYWGTPIPMIECPSCGPVAVPSQQLPVLLCPSTTTEGTSGPDRQQWAQCLCPRCGGPASRETDTMDTFVDSSWYFLRFLDPRHTDAPFSRECADEGMPVDVYVGGEEHAVLHLYFARFFQHFLQSEQLTKHSEPFSRLLLVGRIKSRAYQRYSDGKYLSLDQVDTSVAPPVEAETREPVKAVVEKMSKSKHNGVDPAAVIAEYSTDLTRLAVLRGEAPDSNRSWQDDSVEPAYKWMNNIWRTVGSFVTARQEPESCSPALEADLSEACASLRDTRNRTVAEVTKLYQEFQFHSAIMKLETFTRQIRAAPKASLLTEEYERALAALLLMLAPITPHASAELWHALAAHGTVYRGREGFVQDQPWPQPSPGYELPIHFAVFVNQENVHSESLTGPDVEELMDEQRALCRAVDHTPRVRDLLAGQPVLHSSVRYAPAGLGIVVEIRTMDRLALKKQRKKKKMEVAAARKAAKGK